MDPTKIEDVTSWPRPSTVSEVRSFLGLTGYYQRFMEEFFRITTPLTELTRKGTHLFGAQHVRAVSKILSKILLLHRSLQCYMDLKVL